MDCKTNCCIKKRGAESDIIIASRNNLKMVKSKRKRRETPKDLSISKSLSSTQATLKGRKSID